MADVILGDALLIKLILIFLCNGVRWLLSLSRHSSSCHHYFRSYFSAYAVLSFMSYQQALSNMKRILRVHLLTRSGCLGSLFKQITNMRMLGGILIENRINNTNPNHSW